jgi:hypothetical protein
MRLTRETLIRIARETAQKNALSDPGLIAAYLTGSVCTDNPFLGNTTDIDIVFVHAGLPRVHREILPLTPEVHLDIIHNPRSDYEKPKDLRIHPWLGPELYDPLPLYITQHFFEYVQAGVRAEYHQPLNVLARARRCHENARQIWFGIQPDQKSNPILLLSYLKAIRHAANAIAALNGGPLAERRFLLQFPIRAEAAGGPGLSDLLLVLLGKEKTNSASLGDFLSAWEKDFLDASSFARAHENLAGPRLAYYKMAFISMLAGESPWSVLWPLIHTWTLAAAAIPPTRRLDWQTACETLELTGDAFRSRLDGLDHFLDEVEAILEKYAISQGI